MLSCQAAKEKTTWNLLTFRFSYDKKDFEGFHIRRKNETKET
jgi:hypothetical protein